MSKLELLEKCKELGVTNCNSKNKSQLIELINSKQKITISETNTKVGLNSMSQHQNIISNEVKNENIKYNFIEVS